MANSDDRVYGDSPPAFSGDPEKFREYKKRIQVWCLSTRVEEAKQGPRVLAQLSGAAWDSCAELDVVSLTEADGVSKILTQLERDFGASEDVQSMEYIEECLYGTVRRPKETAPEFLTRMDHQFRRLEQHCEMAFPSIAKGYITARQFGLGTRDIREMMAVTRGNLSYDMVRKAVRRLHHDSQIATSGGNRSVSALAGGKNVQSVFAAVAGETRVPPPPLPCGQDERQFDDMPQMVDEDPEMVAAADETFGNEELPSEIDESEAEEIFLSFGEAREKAKNRKLSRGWSQDVMLKDDRKARITNRTSRARVMSKVRCYGCGKIGHMKRDCRSRNRQPSKFGGDQGRPGGSRDNKPDSAFIAEEIALSSFVEVEAALAPTEQAMIVRNFDYCSESDHE